MAGKGKKGGSNTEAQPLQFWLAGSVVREYMERLVANHFPDLALVVDRIAIVMRSKAAMSGGRVVLGKTVKAPKMIEVLGTKRWVFIIEIAGDVWADASDEKRIGTLTHCLCCCKVTYDKGGTEKYGLSKPEIQMFQKELAICGVWHNLTDENGEAAGAEAAASLEEVFGVED